MSTPLRLLVAVLLAGLGLGPAEAQVRIFVLGSSTAEGVGASPSDSSWVGRFRAHARSIHPDNVVTNLARGGYTTYHIRPNGSPSVSGRPAPDVTRNITYALLFNPDAIIINMPSNDATQGFTVAEQLANYDRILAAAGSVPVWISTTQPRNLSESGRANLVAVRDSTLARYGDRALDFWAQIANPDGTVHAAYNAGDGIHLNNAGHRVLFQRVASAGIVEAVTSAEEGVPSAALRLRAWPSPFRAESRVAFETREAGAVSLRAYDALGREAAVLFEGELPAGTHEARLSGHGLRAGVYWLRLQQGGRTVSLPVLRIR
jgi:lysophospholipase L1-like esterase